MNTVIQMTKARPVPTWLRAALVAAVAAGTTFPLVSARALAEPDNRASYVSSASANAGVTRTELVRRELAVPGREAIQVRVDLAPGVAFPAHLHPGEELAFVIEGELEYRLNGGPPIVLKAGEALFIPAGTVHTARNVGTGNAAELATYIVETGKPLVAFAPPVPAN